ncbi:MAG TPA: flagellar filament capping protein FliD [Solirubrobacteraceae bacterium]|jgi:flagellar hook-associated protein 2
MASGIRLGGLSSGLDTEAIVSQLMAIERQPRGRLERKQAAVQARQDALRDISTKLKTLKSAAQALASSGTWAPTQAVTTSDAARVGARAVGSITPGTYSVDVTQVATSASRTFSTQVRPNPTTLTFTTTSTGSQYSVNVPANSTVDDIVRVINSDPNAPVAARNYNGQLLVSARATGAGGNFTVNSPNIITGETANTTGVDAQFSVNGTAYTRSSNSVTDAVAGLELTLSGTTAPGTPATVTVGVAAVDSKGLATRVKAFVDAYNAVVDATRSRTTEKRVTNPQTTADAKKGVLFGDSGLNNMLSQLRVAVMDPASVGNSLTMDEFAEIGVSTGVATGGTSSPDSVAGRLVFDEAKFLKAYESDPGSVENLLRGTAFSTGLSARLDTVIQPFTEVGGMFDGRITASTSELTRLGDQLKRMDERLGRKETYLRRQFTALETALSKLNSQSQDLAARLPSVNNDS